jgi:hypothetical protein
MKTIRTALCLSLLSSMSAFACMGVQIESAQEDDACAVFEGWSMRYVLHAGAVPGVTPGALSKVTFTVSKTLRKTPQKNYRRRCLQHGRRSLAVTADHRA